MKEIEKTTKIYVADDGMEFISRDECEKYETLNSNIQYYVVRHAPDLNETGVFMKTSVVAVYSDRYANHMEIVRNWCVKTKGYPILSASVQGFGWQKGFEIIPNNQDGYAKKLWDKFEAGEEVDKHQSWTFPTFGEKVFLSPIEVDGFPKPFNYVKEWSLNM